MIILPAIDIKGGKCVRLTQGDYDKETVYSDSPAAQAMTWEKQGAEFIHLVDLDGAKAGHPVNLEIILEICSKIKIPCELGGGIRTPDDVRKVLDCGVSRVILGTSICENPLSAEKFINEFGPEKIVAGIDAKNGKAAVRGWLENTGADAFELAAKLNKAGVSRIIYTDIATDGMLSGPNLEAMALICDKVKSCKIIASGGVSSEKDIVSLIELKKNNLEGAIVGKALYDGRVSLKNLLKIAKA